MSEKQLTQPIFEYDEKWEVYMSNQKLPYILDEKQYFLFKKMIVSGSKGIVHFDDFSLNLTYFVSSYRKSRARKKNYQLEAPKEKEMTQEEREKARKKIEQIKATLKNKFSVNGSSEAGT